MNVNRLLGILAILLLTAASALYAQKPVKVKGVQGRWQVSDDITLKQAEERAFMEAKKAALQKAPFTKEVTYQNVLEWVYSIPAVQRCAFYDMVLIK